MDFKGDEVVWVEYLGGDTTVLPLFGRDAVVWCCWRYGVLRYCGVVQPGVGL